MVLYNGARRYAHREVAGLLRQAHDPNRPLPDVTFDDQLTVTAGEDRIELAYHGPNHSPGNIFTYLPAQRVLMLVDVVFPGWVPFAYLAESQNIPGWLEAPGAGARLSVPHVHRGPPHPARHPRRRGHPAGVRGRSQGAAANAIDTFNVADVYKSVDRQTRGPSSAATWTASPPRRQRGRPPLDRPARRGRRLHPGQRLPTRRVTAHRLRAPRTVRDPSLGVLCCASK